MRCEVVAVGTELLLGQIVDTNSSWMGEQLALAGIDSHFQTKVGDNLGRIVLALRTALAERLAPRLDALEQLGDGAPTIAFLASGIEGIKVRITVKQPDADSAKQMLAAEEAEVRALLGDIVFGADDETMEDAVGSLL